MGNVAISAAEADIPPKTRPFQTAFVSIRLFHHENKDGDFHALNTIGKALAEIICCRWCVELRTRGETAATYPITYK
jgi:hypothetical protein